MARIDYIETIRRVDFPEKVWEWLDLLGEVIGATQNEAISHENYVADTPYRKLLVISINKDITSLNAIGLLLRCELVHQAASHVRLLCEGLITLSCIAKDPVSRAARFFGYAKIEAFDTASSLLQWSGAKRGLKHAQLRWPTQ